MGRGMGLFRGCGGFMVGFEAANYTFDAEGRWSKLAGSTRSLQT